MGGRFKGVTGWMIGPCDQAGNVGVGAVIGQTMMEQLGRQFWDIMTIRQTMRG